MSPPAHNLADEPWLPAVRIDGTRTQLSLRDLFKQAHDLAEFDAPHPPAMIGLLRLLSALTYRVTDAPTGDADDLEDVLDGLADAGRFNSDRIDSYFDRYQDRFWLIHPERPFLQDPRLALEAPKRAGVNKITPGRPDSATPVLIIQHTGLAPAPLTVHEAVGSLLTYLLFGPAGRCATRTHGSRSSADGKAGPIRGSLSFHPTGSTVFATMCAALVAASEPTGRPLVWEAPELQDPSVAPDTSGHPLYRLIPESTRAVLLVADSDGMIADAHATWGATGAAPVDRDLFIPVNADKDARGDRGGDVLRTRKTDLGRDLRELLPEVLTGNDDWVVPYALQNLPAGMGDYGVRMLGFAQDGQAKDLGWVDAVSPVPVISNNPRFRYEISQLASTLTSVDQQLKSRLARVWGGVNAGPGDRIKPDYSGPWTANWIGKDKTPPARLALWAETDHAFWAAAADIADTLANNGNTTDIHERFHRTAQATARRIAGRTVEPMRANPRFARAIALERL